jgi:hypothetical protein
VSRETELWPRRKRTRIKDAGTVYVWGNSLLLVDSPLAPAISLYLGRIRTRCRDYLVVTSYQMVEVLYQSSTKSESEMVKSGWPSKNKMIIIARGN